MSVGRAYLDELHARLTAEREAEQVTCRCAWCDWTLADTLKAARDAHAAHRTAQHPERVVKRRKTRHRPSPTLVAGGKTLDDNIAGARAQGANGSDTPPPEPAAEPEPEPEPEPDEPAPPTPIAAAAPTRCHADGCTMPPRYHAGRYAGLCHEHRNHAAHKRGNRRTRKATA